jgi:trk system potassium uptake protein TrkH
MRHRFDTMGTVLHVLGSLLVVLSGFLAVPAVMAWAWGERSAGGGPAVWAFVGPAVLSLGSGLGLKTVFRRRGLGGVQAALICALGWVVCSAVGALPFVLGIGASYLDGYFETMSGFTTTGITMFGGLDAMPRSVLFWRALTQWIGGLGILTFFLAVTRQDGSSHRLFGAESHKIELGRPVPGLANTIKILWGIYAGFTVVIVVGLVLAGMGLFDSVCHAFTALSTGGFSPHDASIEHYQQAGYAGYRWIEYILIVGMLMGGVNFLVHYRWVRGDVRALGDNTEMRYWWGLLGLFVGVIVLERVLRLEDWSGVRAGSGAWWGRLESDFRTVSFQVVSILTTTGFGTRDIGGAHFGEAARQLFLVMMVIGGCVGSTGGGIKVLRVGILFRLIRREVYRVIAPRRALTDIFVDGKRLEPAELRRVAGLFFCWMVLLVFGGVMTALLSGWGGYASFSGMFSALGNIGPCYIPTPAMGELPSVVKLVYIVGMLAGRLEILPVLILLSPRAWQS